jgi:steroid 5-alpha reductase family enzyme
MSPYFAMAGIGLFVTFVFFSLTWYLQYRLKDSGVVDVLWGLSVGALGLFYCSVGYGLLNRRVIVGVLVAAWSFRLSYHLFERWQKLPEDKRYAALKKKWGKQAQVRMYRFYQMQGLGAMVCSLPLLLAASNVSDFGMWDFIGLVVWMIAMFGESIADAQLSGFKSKPENEGEVCDVGLWRYSRHPNYFFEWLHWVAYVFFCVTAQWGLLAIVAPLLMWFWLTRVTGIPLSEEQAALTRGDKYRSYQASTSAFFPWFPKQAL